MGRQDDSPPGGGFCKARLRDEVDADLIRTLAQRVAAFHASADHGEHISSFAALTWWPVTRELHSSDATNRIDAQPGRLRLRALTEEA